MNNIVITRGIQIHFTNMATFAVYIFQAFTLIQQLHFHWDSSFIFIIIIIYDYYCHNTLLEIHYWIINDKKSLPESLFWKHDKINLQKLSARMELLEV